MRSSGCGRVRIGVALLCLGAMAWGRGGVHAGEVQDVAFELVTENALTPNALSPNALSPDALHPDVLSPRALSPDSLDPVALANLKDDGSVGERSRMLLKYIVVCAFDASQSFEFLWTDTTGQSRSERYVGRLGLATAWALQPLDMAEQQLVSACLAAHTNYFGLSVLLSVRSPQEPLRALTGSQELIDFPWIEGAFWGNAFESPPRLYACYEPANVDHSRSLGRDCAAGHLAVDPVTGQNTIEACGPIQIVGACSEHCAPLDNTGQYYPSCRASANGAATTLVITTALSP